MSRLNINHLIVCGVVYNFGSSYIARKEYKEKLDSVSLRLEDKMDVILDKVKLNHTDIENKLNNSVNRLQDKTDILKDNLVVKIDVVKDNLVDKIDVVKTNSELGIEVVKEEVKSTAEKLEKVSREVHSSIVDNHTGIDSKTLLYITLGTIVIIGSLGLSYYAYVSIYGGATALSNNLKSVSETPKDLYLKVGDVLNNRTTVPADDVLKSALSNSDKCNISDESVSNLIPVREDILKDTSSLANINSDSINPEFYG
jgi:hypothetical protein